MFIIERVIRLSPGAGTPGTPLFETAKAPLRTRVPCTEKISDSSMGAWLHLFLPLEQLAGILPYLVVGHVHGLKASSH